MDSHKTDNMRRCHDCKEVRKVVAYCFKCNNFLCNQCSDFHPNDDENVEHRLYTLDLTRGALEILTLEKLTSLAEDPRCKTHGEHSAQLYCETCGNLLVCVACTHSGHSGHKTHQYQSLAASEREKLVAVLSELKEHEAALYELPKRVENAQRKLDANVKAKIEKVEFRHRWASEEISKKAETGKAELQWSKIKSIHIEIDDNFSARIDKLSWRLKDSNERITTAQAQNEKELQRIADHSKHTINWYENFTATSSTVLASNDEWTYSRCLPDINASSGSLIKDVMREFRGLDSLSEIRISDSSLRFVDEVTITEEESVVDVEGREEVFGITSSEDGNIVITGRVSLEKSYIKVINRKGGIVRHDQIGRVVGSRFAPDRYCDSLSQSLVATSCKNQQIGIYNASDGKYVEKDITDVIIIHWPGQGRCIATDDENNIYVFAELRGILVFDDKLNYLRSFRTPEVIKWLYDMTVHEGHLLICDAVGGQAYAVTMEGQEAEVVFPFTKPDLDGRDWRPICVCADSHGFVYMLWALRGSRSGKILTQHSPDGRDLLTTRRVDEDAYRMTTIGMGGGVEKLLIATLRTGKLYTYGLL